MKKQFVVEAFGQLLGVTEDLDRAEVALRIQYTKDFPEKDASLLRFQAGPWGWYLAVEPKRLTSDYTAKETVRL